MASPFGVITLFAAGESRWTLSPGQYTWQIERGHEYARQTGTIDVVAGGTAEIDITLQRIANLRDEGWYSGDLHVHRAVKDIELLMRAEDLDFAPLITWWNTQNLWQNSALPQETAIKFDQRVYTVMAGEDERDGGALLYFNLQRPLALPDRRKSAEFPSPMTFVPQARALNGAAWIDIEKPFWWDVPTWLASGQMNSIGIANNHMCRSQMLANEAWGKPRDVSRLPNPRGNGFWTQEIYYHALNAGIRIPPSAGSAFGRVAQPGRLQSRLCAVGPTSFVCCVVRCFVGWTLLCYQRAIAQGPSQWESCRPDIQDRRLWSFAGRIVDPADVQ